MVAEGLGNCTNRYECMATRPKCIDVENIARSSREYMRTSCPPPGTAFSPSSVPAS